MNSKYLLGLLALSAFALLCSCSGLKGGGCTTNCGGSTANVTISIYDTPPTNTNVLSFTLPIAGISLTPSSGSNASVATAVPAVEVTRLQTESMVIADQASVPAATYSAINVTLGPTSSTNNIFINTSGSTITSSAGSCLNNTVCTLPVGAIFAVTIPLPLTLSANQNQWIGLDFNLNNAITSTNGISVDFSQTGVLTATTKTRTGIPSGSVDTVQDFIGVVTAYSAGSSITVQSGMTGTSLTASLSSSTEYDLAPVNYSGCSGTAGACLAVGSTVSVDTLLSASGTFAATEVDVLRTSSVDEVEGIIYPTSNPGQVGMILADKVSTSGNATLAASTTTIGSGVILDIGSLSPNYSIDTKTLTIPLPAPTGFTGSGDLFGGQVIRAQVTNVASTGSGITAQATNILLRYSRISGTVSTVAGNNFMIGNLPSYITALNPTLGANPTVATYLNYTAFDGVTGTTDQAFVNGASVSIRALYLNNSKISAPFQAGKVRLP